jgi:spermidine synthase
MLYRRLVHVGLLAVLAPTAAAFAQQRVLFEKQSPYNTVVVTEDDRGLRTLLFERGGVRQSVVKPGDPDHLELAYARVMPAGLALVKAPERILIVGLGGGTIPSFLHKHYPRTRIDVVDIDPVVVEAAKKFFAFREDATLHAYVDDGRRFTENCRQPYDVIFLDAFGSESIPYHLATREFLQAVRAAVSPKGVVLANVWSSNSNPLYDSMVRTYQDVFDGLYVIDVFGAGNKILVALPRKEEIRVDDLVQKARAVSKERRLPFDLGDFVAQGFRKPEADGTGGEVLRDKKPAKKAG